ncbi:hypothetical protein DLAC_03473 [Tieghemostelium lacteum]|uniref:NECAP PHear domain-containing protein n=1 Tax=Tieghemostelium lacteum TaxID=361077 RepID=A0A152A275_TIELA|nr:hypothetical protein DLAC_03473 [Tieghemostelium lacteum]|eukprot:KYR00304.1 hypothetical protein DLAC_03473 [Tieghemostelium lacteum]
MEEDYEQTLLIKKECFIYRIGPRPSGAGYKAQDWDPSTYIWSGRLVIIARGDQCTIRFEDVNTGEVFAQCPVDDQSVEPVIDSSRYFVIRIIDGTRHAFVGMGFTDRSDAFDFNATLQDHKTHVKNRHDIERQRAIYENQPKVDYSLKTNQTIHIPFKAQSKTAATTQNFAPVTLTSTGGFLLSPPPGSKPKTQSQPPQQQQSFNPSNPFSNNNSSNSFWN